MRLFLLLSGILESSWKRQMGLPERAHQGFFVVIPGEMERQQPILSEAQGAEFIGCS
jgi:hypothetical protein